MARMLSRAHRACPLAQLINSKSKIDTYKIYVYIYCFFFSDMSNRANLSKNSPATPVYQEATPGPRQQHRKGAHKKKKGGRF